MELSFFDDHFSSNVLTHVTVYIFKAWTVPCCPQETPSLAPHRDPCRPLPCLLFSCQVGVGRTNLGMILGALVIHHLKGAPKQAMWDSCVIGFYIADVTTAYTCVCTSVPFWCIWSCSLPSRSERTQDRPEFQIIKMLTSRLPEGQQVLEEVRTSLCPWEHGELVPLPLQTCSPSLKTELHFGSFTFTVRP